MIGPAVGGLLYGLSPSLVYLLAAASCAAGALSVMAMHPRPAAAAAQLETGTPADASSVFEGLRFVGRTQILLGAILLDLLAVLFGGAVALLPVFARSILHVGPTGLGLLRAAPAVGALIAAAVLTRRPLGGRAGRTMPVVVALYGVSIIVVGLSRVFLLSLLALGVSGFVDLFRMNIRSTTVALVTHQPARRVRVRPGRLPGRHHSGGGRGRRDHDPHRPGLATTLPGPG